MTPKHLAEPSRAASWTHSGPLVGNPVLDREKISAPQAVDVCIYLTYVMGDVMKDNWGGDMSVGCTAWSSCSLALAWAMDR